MKQQRINKVLKKMKELELSQLIVTSPASLYYLIGKWISAGERMIALYLNTDGECKLLVNRLFPIEEDLGIDIIWFNDSDDSVKILSEVIKKGEVLGDRKSVV